jgi:hypothetical protein
VQNLLAKTPKSLGEAGSLGLEVEEYGRLVTVLRGLLVRQKVRWRRRAQQQQQQQGQKPQQAQGPPLPGHLQQRLQQ